MQNIYTYLFINFLIGIQFDHMLGVVQRLPFHSTIVLRVFTHIAYALLFSCRSEYVIIYIFFYVYTQELFYVKKFVF